MPNDDSLAHRIRTALASRNDVEEREMFGGLAFMISGHLCCGVLGKSLLARIGPEAYESTLEEAHVREMDYTGRPMRGLVFVDPPGVASTEALEGWVDRSLAFAETLPSKKG